MKKYYRIIRESAAHIAEAAGQTVEALRNKLVEQEPAFTDRMLGRIEQAMAEYEVRGVKWTAKTLTDHGRGSQEKEYGADFIGILEIDLQDFSVKKGFLAQSKMVEPNVYISPKDYARMQAQCEQMLSITPDSFLFVYSTQGIIVVPAIAVVSATRCNPHELYYRSISRFYEEHFESFIGDRRLSSPTIDVLETIRRELRGRAMLYLLAKSTF